MKLMGMIFISMELFDVLGLVKGLGEIEQVRNSTGITLEVKSSNLVKFIEVFDDSVSIDGVCQTAVMLMKTLLL